MPTVVQCVCSLLLLILFALNPAVASQSIAISADIPAQAQAENWLLLDVRSKDEFDDGHIPGAINIPHDKIDAFADQLPADANKKIVVYCRSGRRAGLAIEELTRRDYQNVYHLNGDMLGWEARELPVEKSEDAPPPQQ